MADWWMLRAQWLTGGWVEARLIFIKVKHYDYPNEEEKQTLRLHRSTLQKPVCT